MRPLRPSPIPTDVLIHHHITSIRIRMLCGYFFLPNRLQRVDDPSDGCQCGFMAIELHKGSCLCGGVRYEVEGPLTAMACCHCRECRKASGAEFATNASIASSNFRLLSGQALLREFESSPGQARVFCGKCGSPIMKRIADKPDILRLRLGCLDSPLEQKPRARVFLSEKLLFSEISDEIPCFDTIPAAKSSV